MSTNQRFAAVLTGLLLPVVLWANASPSRQDKTAPAQEVVRTQRIELVDKDGKVHGVIGVMADGTTAVILQDKDGKERASLKMAADGGTSLHLTDKDGKETTLPSSGQ